MNNSKKLQTNTIPLTIQTHPEWCQLYEALLAFEVSSYEAVPFSFKHRLMREHSWTETYTDRVWFEYKRFLFMLATTERFICPAEDVDQIWHTHLIYTRSYWDDLCQNLIGKPLHHVPSRGGNTETSDFYRCYAKTLERYQELFDEAPPLDIWVKPEQRLQDTPYFRLINTRTHWVMPKPNGSKFKWLVGISLGTAFIGSQIPNVYADTSAALDTYSFVLVFFGFILIFFVLIPLRTKRCPSCKKWGALNMTHLESIEKPDEHEYRCKSCGYRVWRKKSKNGGCGGGSGGGCGGSGG